MINDFSSHLMGGEPAERDELEAASVGFVGGFGGRGEDVGFISGIGEVTGAAHHRLADGAGEHMAGGVAGIAVGVRWICRWARC